MIEQRKPNLQSTFCTVCASNTLIYDYMKYKMSYYHKSLSSKFSPERHKKITPLYLQENELNKFIESLDGLSKEFYRGLRQLSRGVPWMSS